MTTTPTSQTKQHHPNNNNSSPNQLVFSCFILLNFLTLTDRAIIPGSSREFAAFVGSAYDSPEIVADSPDSGLGLLQAAFVGGYSVAIVICGHLVHKVRWKFLISWGLAIWIVAVLGSGLSEVFNSFWLLFLSRLISGVSEASFHVVAPPMIQARGGIHAGLWLSLFISAYPVGLAFGYVYSSLISNNPNLGWPWAFYFEAIVGFPLLILCCCLKDDTNGGILAPEKPLLEEKEGSLNLVGVEERSEEQREATYEASSSLRLYEEDSILEHKKPLQKQQHTPSRLSIWEEMQVCLSSNILIFITLAQSVIVAVTVALGTFGGAFILALELYDSEETAAMMFGCAAAVAGILGTPLGGVIVDHVQARVGDNASPVQTLSLLLPRINCGLILGTLFIWPTALPQSPVSFLGFLFFGWFFLFTTQSGTQWSVMLSVDEVHRPNAIAFTQFMTHVLGDVPFPIIFGAIKDYMAPACIVTKEGIFADVEGCKNQHAGIRATLAIAYSYMMLAILFFEVARQYAMAQWKRELSGIENLRVKGDFEDVEEFKEMEREPELA